MRQIPVLFLLVACTTGADPKEESTTIPTDPLPTTELPSPTTEPTDPLFCDLTGPGPFAVDTDAACTAPPVVGAFDPVTEWTWTENPIHPGYHQVVVTPVVLDLDGDDVPDIVFTAFEGMYYAAGGALTAISGADGTTLWSVREAGGYHPRGTGTAALGDLDGDGEPEVVVPALEGLMVVDRQGTLVWGAPTDTNGMPAIGDIDGDGLAEVVFGRTVFSGDGAPRWTGTAGQGGTLNVASFPVDLDGDGLEEVVAGNTVYEHDGAVRWSDGRTDGKPAVADFDGDGDPEIVRVYAGTVHLADADGTVLWTFALGDAGGGAPTVADLDGDGLPEVAVASASTFRVVDTDGTELWSQPTDDSSSALTGSSVFDFEGDGVLEVVYADEHTLRVFDGPTGAVKMQWDSHSSGTLHEYPVVADLDRDGSAEIVVASNDYAWEGSVGITVIGDRTSSWAPARPVWNQHAYAITNVDDDGGIPAVQVPSWGTANSFRAGNTEPRADTPAADLGIGDPVSCLDECAADRVWAWFPVENRGLVEGVVTVDVSRGDGTPIAAFEATVGVGAGVWVGPVALSAADFGAGGVSAAVGSSEPECDENNNVWSWAAFPCP